ncbi:hypothetical protein F0562_034880 [Nyssa sinensis]|uniref:Uncharacterized protein n=1 Tax=Nyssa sinensis TaxID=561372 RepID=A0A5J5A8K8_9ASTE|nr:hypothetical protein F0562_034880 [Nyssa sinensis]
MTSTWSLVPMLCSPTGLPYRLVLETAPFLLGTLYPAIDLRTAGYTTQMSVELMDTQFGVGSPNVPMLANMSLFNDVFICPTPTKCKVECADEIIERSNCRINKYDTTVYIRGL